MGHVLARSTHADASCSLAGSSAESLRAGPTPACRGTGEYQERGQKEKEEEGEGNATMNWWLAHLGTILGVVLVPPFLARILREHRPPASTIAWMLGVLLAPYLAVPFYLLVGARKRRRLTRGDDGGKLLRYERPRPSDPESGPEAILCGDGISAATRGNDVTLLTTGERAFDALLALVKQARASVSVSIFILGDDAAGNAILDALIERAGAGVEVRLLLDALFYFRADRGRLRALSRAGGRIARFGGPRNLRNHRKIVVVDGAHAWVAGMNLAEEYMGPTPLLGRWRDIGVTVTGRAVGRLADVLASDWAFATGEAVVGPPVRAPSQPSVPPPTEAGAAIQVVPSGPDSAGDSLYDALLAGIYSARRRVWIATPYFVPDEALSRALSVAARRGTDVRIVVPARSNHRIADLAGGTYLREIAHAGGSVRAYPDMLHAKVAVIDDALGVLGSANFDMRSLFLNYEIALFFYSHAQVAELCAWFDDVIRGCAPLEPAGRARALAEDVGRLFAPLA
jgi:cardiolipin synthase